MPAAIVATTTHHGTGMPVVRAIMHTSLSDPRNRIGVGASSAAEKPPALTDPSAVRGGSELGIEDGLTKHGVHAILEARCVAEELVAFQVRALVVPLLRDVEPVRTARQEQERGCRRIVGGHCGATECTGPSRRTHDGDPARPSPLPIGRSSHLAASKARALLAYHSLRWSFASRSTRRASSRWRRRRAATRQLRSQRLRSSLTRRVMGVFSYS
jgi:hypothetical protein